MDDTFYRILSIDGGGIKGVFPAALLARLEDQIGSPIADHFDLIVGTSTGGIIAIGLGLGLSAQEILTFYEKHGPEIFSIDAPRGLRRLRRHLPGILKPKYPSDRLRSALLDALGTRRLGESRNRLVIPAWHRETERVYLYKTAHHPRLETDYKQPAVDAAMATAAAPTFFEPYLAANEVELVDGGVWANNPIGVAVTEAIGLLKWPAHQIKILSLGTIGDVRSVPKRLSSFDMAWKVYMTHLFMAGQSHGAMGAAKIMTGDVNERQAIWRIDHHAPYGRFKIDDPEGIKDLKDRAFAEARECLPDLRKHFFHQPADPFVPYHRLEADHADDS